MTIIISFITLYLLAGLVYAFYVASNNKEPWYTFFINVLGGPILYIYMYILTRKGKEPPLPNF